MNQGYDKFINKLLFYLSLLFISHSQEITEFLKSLIRQDVKKAVIPFLTNDWLPV